MNLYYSNILFSYFCCNITYYVYHIIFIIVTNDDNQARRECLNLTEAITNTPPPIVLAAANENKKFLCKNELPSLVLEAFSCTLYGRDLIWYFNDQRITAFLPGDSVGRTVNTSIPKSSPIYNVTAILTRTTQVPSLSRSNLPFYISVLLVQPYNESQTEFEPYNVTCQTHCTGNNSRAVCQTKQYEVAGMLKL